MLIKKRWILKIRVDPITSFSLQVYWKSLNKKSPLVNFTELSSLVHRCILVGSRKYFFKIESIFRCNWRLADFSKQLGRIAVLTCCVVRLDGSPEMGQWESVYFFMKAFQKFATSTMFKHWCLAAKKMTFFKFLAYFSQWCLIFLANFIPTNRGNWGIQLLHLNLAYKCKKYSVFKHIEENKQ